ncbi:lipase family alpha/beta hydrolase [Vibrio astriarenae]
MRTSLTRCLVTLSIFVALVGCSTPSPIHTQYADQTVVIIHGLSKSERNMNTVKQGVMAAGFSVCMVDYSSVWATFEDVLESVDQQVDQCAKETKHLHFVGHSLGGLLSRAYLNDPDNQATKQKLGRVVMIGTPNHGSPLADKHANRWYAGIVGEVPRSLTSDDQGFSQQLPTPDYSLGIIAGTSHYIVTNHLFNGPNDGLVSVESTQLANMTDFIELDVGHMAMPHDEQVIYQVIHFLLNGQFEH